MRPVVLLDAVRTPVGGRGGKLSGWHPADLAGALLVALAERSGFDPGTVDDVVLGCAMPVGSQGFNLARSAVLAAGWPDAVPAGTIDRQGVSGLSAVIAAVRAVASGGCELVVAGGVEVMSTTPQGATLVPGAVPFGPLVADRYRDAGGLVPAGQAAERLGEALGLDRAALDAFALRSHQRSSPDAGVVPVATRIFDRDKGEVVRPGTTVTSDELPRAGLTMEELAEARPAFAPDGLVTALNSAAIADGAAAVVVASEAAAAALGKVPLAHVHGAAEVGVDPIEALTGAVPATERVLAEVGMLAADIDCFEVGEPFAAVPLGWARALGVDLDRVNANGGGIAIGEPTGAAGARLLVTLAHELVRTGGRCGVATTVAIGGLGAAMLLERRA